jgi:hypothetical protein
MQDGQVAMLFAWSSPWKVSKLSIYLKCKRSAEKVRRQHRRGSLHGTDEANLLCIVSAADSQTTYIHKVGSVLRTNLLLWHFVLFFWDAVDNKQILPLPIHMLQVGRTTIRLLYAFLIVWTKQMLYAQNGWQIWIYTLL